MMHNQQYARTHIATVIKQYSQCIKYQNLSKNLKFVQLYKSNRTFKPQYEIAANAAPA